MIGCYPGNIILTDPGQQITQLWLFTRLRWNHDFDATGLRVRLDLPAQGIGYMNVKPNPPTSGALARDAVCVWQLRLLPLRVGDLLRVSIEQGSAILPCGELLAVEAAKPTRH